MLLIVGLGNPGKEYQLNRHNAGFMAVNNIVHRYNFSFFKEKMRGEISEGEILKERAIILKPLTYMNLSGESVLKVQSFYKIPLSNIIVFHDDMDIEFTKIKVKNGGGAGGHNGLKSIDANIGKEYKRVRIGISHPKGKNEVVDFVLGNFSKPDLVEMEKRFELISDNIEYLINNDYSKFIEKVNKDGF